MQTNDPLLQQLIDGQDANFEKKAAEWVLVDNLVNSRKMRNNSNKAKVLAGRGKILSLIMSRLIKTGQNAGSMSLA